MLCFETSRNTKENYLSMRTYEELLELAMMSLQGELFTSENLLPHEFHVCFPFLKMPPQETIDVLYESRPYVFYERISEAKGYMKEVDTDRPSVPVFESAFFLDEEEFAIFLNMKVHMGRIR